MPHLTATAYYAPVVLIAVLAFTFLLAYGVTRLGQAPRRKAAPWLCGYMQEAECNRYVAHNFYGEFKSYVHSVENVIVHPTELKRSLHRLKKREVGFRGRAQNLVDLLIFLIGGAKRQAEEAEKETSTQQKSA